MRRLSSGETDVVVPAVKDADEIGDMARSLEIFREGEIERRGMASRERAEQEGQRERAIAVEQLINEFRATVTAVIHTVSENTTNMETTARALSGIAGDADEQTRAATESSEHTSSNVRSVAAATEELGASVREISHQANQAKDVVAKAADIARSADKMVGQLSDGATRIGDVIKLIQSIAGQTNLLALNATIEAARAGEAGRGFAIVASEVKSLAQETAKATEEIAAQVGAIQESTSDAVAAIREISEVMDDINRFTTTIASAVVEQSASTEEIARNVQQAASGANDLAGNMVTVSKAIDQTNRSASQVLEATNTLSSQAGTLQGAVDSFLERVAAA
jgi:methyl-accepting chemotaxis protein